MIVPLYKGKGERTECRNYAGILVDIVRGVTEGMIDDEQYGFRS